MFATHHVHVYNSFCVIGNKNFVEGKLMIKSADITQHTPYMVGLYCSGWVKTGPVGVILTTMNKAFETAEVIHEDFVQGIA